MNIKKIFKNGSTTYYYSSLFFPPKVKKEVFTLYAYVRVADDFVDATPAQTEKFHDWVKKTWQAWEGQEIDEPVITNFVKLAKKKTFEKRWIKAFLNAMESDLAPVNIKTFKQLELYMHGSAEVVGLMMARVLELPPKADQAARLQGKAMQFMNFIRDIEEDRQLGRIYLPQEDRARFNIGRNDWDKSKWHRLIKDQIVKYRDIQQKATQGYQFIPRRYRIPIKTAADLYSWTADRIDQNPSIVWYSQLKPKKPRITTTLIKNLITA